jgi:hypothetical protein
MFALEPLLFFGELLLIRAHGADRFSIARGFAFAGFRY